MGYHVRISPKAEGLSLNLKEVWQYRDLVLLLTKKTFALTYKQTILGPAWIVIKPLVSSLAYLFVFGVVAGMGTGGAPHILFYLTSTAIWGLFSHCLVSNSRTFIDNAHIFGKVYFPRLAASISNVLVGLVIFAIQLLVVAALLVFYAVRGMVCPNWALLPAAAAAVLLLCILGMSLGIILSSLTTKYRDLQILVGFGMSLWMYATPVVYPISQVGTGSLRRLIMLNPVSAPIELIRAALLGSGALEPACLLASLVLTVVCALFGILLFNHVEKTFIDTV